MSIIRRGIVYVTIVFLTYLLAGAFQEDSLAQRIELVFFGLLAVAVALTIRYSREVEFRTTPTDYLLLFIVLAVGVLPGELFAGNEVATGLIKAVIMIYASELLMHARSSRWNPLSISSLIALGWLAAKGLL